MKKSLLKFLRKKLPILGMIAVLSMSSVSVYATEGGLFANDMSLKDNVYSAIKQMEGIMQTSYENARAEMEQIVADNGYNYELTSASFHNAKKPYADFDYRRFIAAYATLQEYCLENGISMGDGIEQVKFLSINVEPAEITEKIPEKTTKYVQNEDGTYSPSGEKFIITDQEVDVYTENENGTFDITGKETITLEERTTTYGEVTFSTISVEELCETFSVDISKVDTLIESRFEAINEAMKEEAAVQINFISSRRDLSEDDRAVIDAILNNASVNSTKKHVVDVAASLIGQVPYEWGGKPSAPGYDKTWWTFDSSGQQKGLDCSGYIQWIFMTAGFDEAIYNKMANTALIGSESIFEDISSEELQIGDLGLLHIVSAGTNHVGMYLGGGRWIHCSSSTGTVSITTNPGFAYFKRLKDVEFDKIASLDEYDIEYTTSNASRSIYVNGNAMIIGDNNMTVEERELDLMTRIVQGEAGGEGYNGWVAVAEVIMNRIKSPKFGYAVDVYSTISAPSQFSAFNTAMAYSEDQLNPDIREACKQVMLGNVGILNNEHVLFFQNPSITGYGWDYFNGHPAYMQIGGHRFYIEPEYADQIPPGLN